MEIRDESNNGFLSKFGERVSSLRSFLGIQEQAFATILDIELEQLAIIENSKAQPDFDILRLISQVTTCDVDFLITGKTFSKRAFSQPFPEDFLQSNYMGISSQQPGWYWESDQNHRIIKSCRPTTDRHTPDGIIGFTPWEYVGADIENAPHWHQHYDALEAHRPIDRFTYRGLTGFIKISGKPVFDCNGNFTGYCGYAASTEMSEAIANWQTGYN